MEYLSQPRLLRHLSQSFRWSNSDRPKVVYALLGVLPLVVISREYAAWELYKWRSVGSLALVEALLLFVLFSLIVAQSRNLRRQAYQSQTAALIGKFAGACIDLPADKSTTEIESSFQKLIDFFHIDRASLFEFSPGKAQLRLLCVRNPTGQPPMLIDLSQLPWATSQLLHGSPIVASRLDQLPAEDAELREVLQARRVRSFLAFPLQAHGRTFAALSFSTVQQERTWEPDLVRTLRTVADIFGSALARQRSEVGMIDSRNRLSGIIKSAMDAIIAVDNEQKIVVFNSTAETMFACPMEEALGQSLERFIPQRFLARHHEHIFRFAETGVTNRAMGTLGDLWALRADGEEFPIEASISQVETDGKKLFTVIVRDITERARAQQRLTESHELNTSILESIRHHVAVLDSSGTVVAATKRGVEFGAVSGINRLDLRVGANYLELCRSAVEAGDRGVAAALAGVLSIYGKKRDYFELEYSENSGVDERWFLMSVTPLRAREGGIVISHQDITERKRHEQAIRDLSGRLISAQEQERSRIARELHDDINQQLAILAIELQQLGNLLPEDLPDAHKTIDALWKKVHALSTDIQQISHELHSSKLDHLGIIAALRGLCSEFSLQYQISAVFQFRQVPTRLASDISLALFRVAQETLHNVAKHSRAKKVRLELAGEGEEGEKIVLRVSDDGVGFDPSGPGHHTGLGMVSMSERVRLEGGSFSVLSKPSMGTQVEATIPLTRQANASNQMSWPDTGRKTG